MRFGVVHQVASYLMVACAFLPLALSGEVDPVVVWATVAASLASLLVQPASWRPARTRAWQLVWNLATVAVFVWQLAAWLRGQMLLASGVDFLCFLLVNKLWNRRASRDYLQVYVISFLMLVAATTLTSDPIFALAFFGYVVFTTWTLILFHLRREMEDSYLIKHSGDAQSERVEVERILQSRRVVGGAFLAGTAAVALVIFLGASLLFLLFPRMEMGGLFGQQRRRGVMTSGFSDRLELGHHGRIVDNPQVVMRVELAGGKPDKPLWFRGVAFDRYERGRWSRSQTGRYRLEAEAGVWRLGTELVDRPRTDWRHALRQEIYLEPLDVPLLFGAAQPAGFFLPTSRPGWSHRVEGAQTGDVYAYSLDAGGRVRPSMSGRRYVVYSFPPPALPRGPWPVAPPEAEIGRQLDIYRQVPSSLAPRLRALARELVEGAISPPAQAEAIARRLREGYRYTRDLPSPSGSDASIDPIEVFLFIRRAGHCEYFASAMTLLLRSLGVAARSVNGFAGGEWNEYGQYLAIRQADAHSWVEVHVDGIGWVPFDPTPAPPVWTGDDGWTARLRRLADTVELAWFKYVIEYDMGKQIDLAASLRRALRDRPGEGHAITRSARAWLSTHRAAIITALLVGGVAVALLLAAHRRRLAPGRGRREAAATRDARRALGRALRALARRGLVKREAETLAELALRARQRADAGAVPLAHLVERYYAVRFGEHPETPGELEGLVRAVVHPLAPPVPSPTPPSTTVS